MIGSTPHELPITVVLVGRRADPGFDFALDSITAQTRAPAAIVVVDDDPPLMPARAYNKGVAQAETPLVLILGSDDALRSDYLERAGDLLAHRADVSFVTCARQEIGWTSRTWRPGAPTIAAAIGGDEGAHLVTLFRRSLWERLEGFDESLPGLPETDFWLRAVGAGYAGTAIADVLVTHVERPPGSDAPASDRYVEAKRALIDRHVEFDSPRAADVLVSLLEAEREARLRLWSLAEARSQLGDAVAAAAAELEEITAMHDERLGPALEWGRLARAVRAAASSLGSAIEQLLIERAIADLSSAGGTRRSMTIRPGEMPTRQPRPTHDLVVFAGALEYERDPRVALEAARSWLRPGGEVVIAAATTAVGPQRRHGFTAELLHHLLSQLFVPESVSVASYGNLMTTLASVADVPVSWLGAAHLEPVDPRYATVVAASARTAEPASGILRRRRPVLRTGSSRAPSRRLHGAILAYGRITEPDGEPQRRVTPPDLFERHVAMIADQYPTVHLLELARTARAGELRPGAIALSFDGGYLDLLDVAAPILATAGIPATTFVAHHSHERRSPGLDSHDRLMTLPELARFATSGGNDVGALLPSEWLHKLDRGPQLAEALRAMREDLAAAVSQPIAAMAYSGRGCDVVATRVVELAGFEVGCTSDRDAVTVDSDPLRLPRVEVRAETPEALRVVLEQMLGPAT